jgi:hypothetical protein
MATAKERTVIFNYASRVLYAIALSTNRFFACDRANVYLTATEKLGIPTFFFALGNSDL